MGQTIYSESLDTLKELEQGEENSLEIKRRPSKLPISKIAQKPELFQPRNNVLDERHITELVRSIKVNKFLDPIKVILVGNTPILIDGHHRLAAYEVAKVKSDVPVTYFDGSIREAVIEAGSSNCKTKLPIDGKQRNNYAWRLVLMDVFSKSEIRKASGVSDGLIGVMRRTKRELTEKGYPLFDYSEWWRARNANKGSDGAFDRQYDEGWEEEESDEWADRLSKTFGTKLLTQPGIAAKALEKHFGRKLDGLLKELSATFKTLMEDEGEEETDF
jgi:hypothetical protein